jgi:polyisoprenoid-binding protein YceI
MAAAARLACSLLLLASGFAPALAAADSLLQQAAGRYSIVPANSEIAFQVPSMGGGGIQGRFTEFDGEFVIDRNLTRSQVAIIIRPGSAATGRERVDRFIRGPSVFDAARFPEATFQSTGVVRAGPRTALVEGVLTAHGIRRPVRLQATLLKLSGREAAFEVAGEFPRSWFDMAAGVPLYADKVRLSVIVTGRRR